MMTQRPRLTDEEIEAMIVPELVEAMYPVLFPVEQQDCAIQDANHEQLSHAAIAAWRAFRRTATREG